MRSRLDCCNSLLNNIAKRDLTKFQRVQHCLTRVVLRAPQFSASLPLLKQLHWLSYRINVKLSTLTYRALSMQQRPYLSSLLHLSNISRQLRSSISQQLIVHKTKVNLGKRAFSVAAPRVWNELFCYLPKNSKYIYSKLHFHHNSSVVPRCDNAFCASLFTIMLNDSGFVAPLSSGSLGYRRQRS